MRRIVLILPHLLSETGEGSFLKANLPGLNRFAESGSIAKCSPMPPDPLISAIYEQSLSPSTAKSVLASLTPEAAWLGLDPHSLVLQDGPLTVAALNADPPARSVHFHLSLMSFEDGAAKKLTTRIAPADLQTIRFAADRLNTNFLTSVWGENADHGLVWEDGSLELGAAPSWAIEGQSIEGWLPEGDGEKMLRRYIDDSINLLSELPLNKQRIEEGLQPINLLWPWGHGFREPVPNLALRRGEICQVESSSMRLQGLTRLAGYRHGDRVGFGKGVRINFAQILQSVNSHDCTLALIDGFSFLHETSRPDQMEWLIDAIDKNLLQPLWDVARREPLRLTLVAPGGYTEPWRRVSGASSIGLVLSYDSRTVASNHVPFDERALEERTLSTIDPWAAIGQGLIA